MGTVISLWLRKSKKSEYMLKLHTLSSIQDHESEVSTCVQIILRIYSLVWSFGQ